MSTFSINNQLIVATIISSVVLVVLVFKCFIVLKLEQSGNWTLKMDLVTLSAMLIVISASLIGLSKPILNSWLKLPIIVDSQYTLMVLGFVHLIGIL